METKTDVKTIIEKMEVGEEQSFAIGVLSNVRAYASNIGMMLGRHYKTRTDRENGAIIVERLS